MASNVPEHTEQATPDWLESVKEHYASLASVATYKSGIIKAGLADDILDIEVVLSQRDLNRNIKRSITVDLVVQQASNNAIRVLAESAPVESTEMAQQSTCTATRRTAILRSANDKEDKQRRFIEVWQSGQLIKNIEVTEQHDAFYNDVDTFGGLAWSSDGSKLVYIAERKASQEELKQFDYQQTWGEKFDSRIHSCLVWVDLTTDVVSVVELSSEDICPGQPLFSPDNQWIYFTGYIVAPRRFGIYACQNRAARLFRCQLDGSKLEAITSESVSIRSPRLSPDSKSIVYLEHSLGGPHASCSALKKYCLESGTTTTLVDKVDEPADDGFTGLYVQNLPTNCWTRYNNEDYLITTTTWRCQSAVIAIHYATGKVTRLSTDKSSSSSSSWSVLNVLGDKLLAIKSSPRIVNDLYIGTLNGDDSLLVTWTRVHRPHSDTAANYLSTIKYQIKSFPEQYYALEAVLIEPVDEIDQHSTVAKGDKRPLIIFPHGGPHAASTTGFSAMTSALVSLGFSVALVNYRGSTGYGYKAVQSLIGHIGDLEVKDTHYVAEQLVATGQYDTERICVTGGSHGGFTTAHLIGQHPTFYRASVMRNPVINVGAMAASTDIPDWNFSEMGMDYCFQKPAVLTPHDYERAFAASPIRYVDKVVAPTLMMLGSNDKRVPHSEGLYWVHVVRGIGKAIVHCKMYPDNGHALDGVEAETTGFTALAGWFMTHAAATNH
ncbi:Alpha/Beta hydrolase protein [Syncephalis plumigaleata]|nr:Alpha/Beta hydrolase protein [Syncephalis plumigaleata]